MSHRSRPLLRSGLVLMIPVMGASVALLSRRVSAEESKNLVTLQVRLLQDGAPLDADLSLTFRIYDASSGGNLLWSEAQTGVPVRNGILAARLGATTSLGNVFRSGLGTSTDRWVAVEQGGSEIVPRVHLTAVPYAQGASAADIASTIWNQATGTALAITDIPAAIAGAGLEANAGLLRISSSAAGNGLTGGSGSALAVNPAALLNNQAAEIDGDQLEIDFTPSNYTRTTVSGTAPNTDDLTAHLKGIDLALAGGGGASSADVSKLAQGVAGGRLTVSSTDPAPAADTTGTTLYYLPYVHDQVALYDTGSSAWELHELSSVSISNSGLTADHNYDVFLYDSSGLTLELVDWSNHGAGTSARATSLTRQDGVWVKSGATGRRYLGTIRTISDGGAVKFTDRAGKRFCWNVSNRVLRSSATTDGGAWTHNGSLAGWNSGSASYKHEFVVGVAEDSLLALASVTNLVPYGANVSLAFGVNSGSSAASGSGSGFEYDNLNQTMITWAGGLPAVGYSYVQALHATTGGTVSFGTYPSMTSLARH